MAGASRDPVDEPGVRLRGGSYQIRVYAGLDPVTGERVYETESTRDPKQITRVRTRLQAKVDQQRSAATSASLAYLIGEWLEVHEIDHSTRVTYVGYIERTIVPALGDVPISKLTPQALEKFYAQLRRCRIRCNRKPFIEHRVDGEHECREVVHRRKPGRPARNWLERHNCVEMKCKVLECKPHECRPLEASSIRQIHAILSSALDTAVRWEWIPSNPASVAKRPKQPLPNPKPPTAEQAAELVKAAWAEDEDWGTLVWLIMVVGPRRGEVLALRVADILLDEGVVNFERAYIDRGGAKLFKGTKTHQTRRPALDPYSMELLAKHIERIAERRRQLGVMMDSEAFLFSYKPDHSKPPHPDGITHRYGRLCKRLGIESHMHALRHYSATELIRAGVDVRTVAGRLGHGGGGTTTLRVYAAWVAESDKRAAGLIADRLPRPTT